MASHSCAEGSHPAPRGRLSIWNQNRSDIVDYDLENGSPFPTAIKGIKETLRLFILLTWAEAPVNSALLSSEGYEESQPKDINEGLAGRNRRVELLLDQESDPDEPL